MRTPTAGMSRCFAATLKHHSSAARRLSCSSSSRFNHARLIGAAQLRFGTPCQVEEERQMAVPSRSPLPERSRRSRPYCARSPESDTVGCQSHPLRRSPATCRPGATADRASPPSRCRRRSTPLPRLPASTRQRRPRATEQPPFRLRQQLVAPVHRRFERALARQAVRLPPVSSRNRSFNRSLICSTDSTFSRAAASSIASGMPSRRRQISATVGALSG